MALGGASLAAGAQGMVYCREYEEISASTLRTCRDALKEWM